jgi:integrase
MPTVSARLGHRNTTTTANIYSHAVRASDRLAADVAGELL